jgi:hypothetical protein
LPPLIASNRDMTKRRPIQVLHDVTQLLGFTAERK